MNDSSVQETWVTVTEGAEIVGYHPVSLGNAVRRMRQLPEEERPIRLRKRSYGWEVWLPDLIVYAAKPRNKPIRKRTSET